MGSLTSRARDHQVIFCGLEVLRLIGERVESRSEIDGEDLKAVLGFLQSVAHPCLENTEELLRSAAFQQGIANHGRARLLFDELSRVADGSGGDQFALLCRQYTTFVADVIIEDRRWLASLPGEQMTLSDFHERERKVDEISRKHAEKLHHLELKYISPHCI